MSYRYFIHCDGCGKEEAGWENAPEGWVTASVTWPASMQFTYCQSCWAAMVKALDNIEEPSA